MFPGIIKAEMDRVNDVMLDEMHAFVEEMDNRCKEMMALLLAMDAAEAWPEHRSFQGGLERVAAEVENIGNLTPENVFPTKPDRLKS